MRLPPTDLHGAYRRDEFSAACGPQWLRNALRHGVLSPLWTGVVADSSRVLDVWTRAAGAQLLGGRDAVLCGPTAAYLHGCRSLGTATTHLLLSYGKGPRNRAGLQIHHSCFFADHIACLDGLNVLVSAGDAARGVASSSSAAPRTVPRGSGRLLIIEHGLPLPEVNFSIRDLDGRELYRIDLAWPPLRVALEYDGYEAHAGRDEPDTARADDLRRRGWIVIRARAEDLADPSRLINELRVVFTRRGYTW